MEQRNINILIGLVLLTAFLVWVNVTELEYIPSQTEGEEPFWSSLLFWQGEQQRSIKTHQGLDLQGGLQVVLEAEEPPAEGVMDAARTIVENRVNALGVTEPLVQIQGDKRIIVELPGIDNPELAIRTIRETGLLEFVDAGFNDIPEGAVIRTTRGDPKFFREDSAVDEVAIDETTTENITTTEEITTENVITEDGSIEATEAETVTVGTTEENTKDIKNPPVYTPDKIYETIITGSDLAQVENAGIEPTSRQISIPFSLTSEGGEKFGEHSGASIGRYLCIVLDKVVLSCPVIQARIDTNGTITLGNNDLTSAQALAIQLRYGSLPVALDVIENRTVGPTLGQDSVQRSVRAGTIGLIVVVLFMLVYYRLPGVVAGLALVLYGLMNFGLYKLLPVTLTLPAVTGFILSVGMAVDANILVFERMKEELRSGRSMNRSMELGFIRAWPSIRDSAISTLITCVILFWFGSNFGASVVKGFAITLALGVITNIFTAVTVTRALLRFMVALAGEGLEKNSFLMGFNLESQGQAPGLVTGLMDIVGQRKLYFVFSMITILLGIGAMVASFVDYGSPLKLSVDFTSGSLMELQFAETVPPEDVRQVFANYQYVDPETNVPIEFKDTDVTTAEQLGQETILIRSKFLQEDIHTEILQEIRTEIGDFTELRFDSVGPAIGQEVGRAGGFAVLIASIAILLFLMFAFRLVANPFRYGMAAVVAMAHDILVTAGVFALCGIFLGWEVDALFLTAILTVIGYSVHDTIIVFDRLRENVPLRRGESFEVVCNRSILETLNRSIVTSLSTMFVVISILVFGGSTIQQFVAILLLGIVSGTYSSIFIAVPLLVAWETGEIGQLFGQGDNHSMEKATV